jgi:hypothetical protein
MDAIRTNNWTDERLGPTLGHMSSIRVLDETAPPLAMTFRNHARKRLALAIEPFGFIRSAEITLGSEDGVSSCRLLVRCADGPSLVVTHHDAEIVKAIDAAAEAAANLLDARHKIAASGIR